MRNVRLDHATLNTTDLATTIAFYSDHLGLHPGPRPDFGFGGAWLYAEDGTDPIVHLIECEDVPTATTAGPVDQVAFRCEGLARYVALLRERNVWFTASAVPGTPFTQIHHFDPNGVRIEATFESEALDDGDIEAEFPPPYPYPTRRVDPPQATALA